MWGSNPGGTPAILHPTPGPTNFRKSSLNLLASRLHHLPLGFIPSCTHVPSGEAGLSRKNFRGERRREENRRRAEYPPHVVGLVLHLSSHFSLTAVPVLQRWSLKPRRMLNSSLRVTCYSFLQPSLSTCWERGTLLGAEVLAMNETSLLALRSFLSCGEGRQLHR